ncbi:MAG: CinA family protein, partial [Candidatus Puniceispirillaceae bacterium]
MTDQELQSLSGLARQVIDRAMAAGVMLTTAESCTGGMVAAALTDIAGASAVLDRGVVTYSNAAKTELLGV